MNDDSDEDESDASDDEIDEIDIEVSKIGKNCYKQIKPSVVKSPPLENHFYVQTYKLFCEKIAKQVFPPQLIVIHMFLNWMAFNVGYSSSSIRNARFVIMDYYKEKGYDLTTKVRELLGKTVLRIKRTHSKKGQNQGKAPMMYNDIKSILSCIPNDYEHRNRARSLFLLAHYTAQRACSCTSITFKDIHFVTNELGRRSVNVTFNKTKGKKKDANIRKIIQEKQDDKTMCFIQAFQDYLLTEFKVDLTNPNEFKKLKEGDKVWNISAPTFTKIIYEISFKTGYPRHHFSSHSFRSGAVCQMLRNCLIGDNHRFTTIFNEARTLGEWVENSQAFKRYIKKSMLGSLICTRFVNPVKQLLSDEKLTETCHFHSIPAVISKWKPNYAYQYKILFNMCRARIIDKYSFLKLSKTCLDRLKKAFKIDIVMQKVLLIYCEQENPYEFAKLIKYYQTFPHNKGSKAAVLYKNIKEEIIFPLLAKSNMMSVFQTLLKYVDEFEFSNSSNDFTNEEDEYIFKNLIENKFENLELKHKGIFRIIDRYVEIKNKYDDADNTEILAHLRKLIDDFDEDAPNQDFESREGEKWIPREDKFILKCIERRKKDEKFTIKNWVLRKGLYGRTESAVKNRCSLLNKKEFKIEVENEKLIDTEWDTTSRSNEKWNSEEIEELIKQYNSKPLKEIKILGRTLNSISFKCREIINLDKKKENKLKVQHEELDNQIKIVSFIRHADNFDLKYVCAYPAKEINVGFDRIDEKINTFKDSVKDIKIHFNDKYIILNFDTFKQFLVKSNKITSIFISCGGNVSDYQNVLAIASLVNPDDYRIYLMLYRENMCINFQNFTGHLLILLKNLFK